MGGSHTHMALPHEEGGEGLGNLVQSRFSGMQLYVPVDQCGVSVKVEDEFSIPGGILGGIQVVQNLALV